MHEDNAGSRALVKEAGMEQSVASTVLHVDLRIFGDWIEDEEPMLLFFVRHSSNLRRYMRQRLNCI